MAFASPNVRPRQRARFADEFWSVPHVHIRQRRASSGYFQSRNPRGWKHDLGAQDVFLDNLGIVVRQQIERMPWKSQYLYTVTFMMRRWAVASTLVLPRAPWWGKHFNSAHRRAVPGEPRSLFRLMPENWIRFTLVEQRVLGLKGEAHSEDQPALDGAADWRLFVHHEYREPWREVHSQSADDITARPTGPDWRMFEDWAEEAWPDLFDQPYDARGTHDDELGSIPDGISFGAIVPESMRAPVAELCLLHPRHSTPDLPPRVGVTEPDRELYESVLTGRYQASLPTCVAHAVCVGLEVALHRSGLRRTGVQFSPAHLHVRTGDSIHEGRHVRDAIRSLQEHGLPCTERSFAYTDLLSSKVDPREYPLEPEIGFVLQNYGSPIVRELDVHDIAEIKAHLAAGWVVVLSTRITEGFRERLRSRSIRDFGLLLNPLPGEAFLDGHAWCLVGYDHVDGATNWKYQGRFVALNWWGARLGASSPHGVGTATIPFAFLLTEGIEAFALRFAGRTPAEQSRRRQARFSPVIRLDRTT